MAVVPISLMGNPEAHSLGTGSGSLPEVHLSSKSQVLPGLPGLQTLGKPVPDLLVTKMVGVGGSAGSAAVALSEEAPEVKPMRGDFSAPSPSS